MASHEVIKLLDFRMFRTDTLVWYSLQLSNGRECWVVTRRYSEFLRCHVKLLELFHREQLPTFPPKEPFWQRVFGGEAARDNWMEERYARLFGYIVGLLDIEGVRCSDALLEFLNAPSHNNGQDPETADGTPAPTAIAVIRSVRVRLTGEPGGLEVVIRADAPAPCAVRLALRPLEELGEEWGDASPSLDSSGSWERLLELDLDPSKSQELTHPFELVPGSLWQVAAVGVSKDGSKGNVVCIQIRAPENETLSQVRESLSPSREVRESLSPSNKAPVTPVPLPELQTELKDPGEASSTATRSSEGVIGPEGKSQEVESEDDEEAQEGDAAKGRRGPAVGRRPKEAAGSSKVISYQGSVAVEYARRIEEQQRQNAARAPHRWSQGLKVSVPVDRLETKSASGAEPLRHHYGTVEVLDHSIQAQQEQQLREDELRLAAWIHHVTGDAQSGAAAAGKGSLQEALQTGEVLCDLINAIWPGKIVGISRGQGAQTLFKRVANITHFVQFCSSLQLSHSLFVPADLAEGRNFRQVIRCLCALAQQVPETWDGPRFQPAPEVRHSD